MLTKVHPILPIIFWGAVLVISFMHGLGLNVSVAHSIEVFVYGAIFWTIFEYGVHRWFFHLEFKNKTLNKLHYYVHHFHHDYPDEWYRLLMPPGLSLPLGVITLGIMHLVFMGSPVMWPFFAGFILGYLSYDYTHLYIHFANPTYKYGKMIRRNHLQHHHAWPNRWFGVSSPFWDYLLGTYVLKSENIERAKTIHHEKTGGQV